MKKLLSNPSRIETRSQSPDRQGMILVIVMMVIVLISLAGYGFLNALMTENKAVYMRGDELQAENLVQSGVAVVQALAAQTDQQRQEFFEEETAAEEIYKGVLVYGESDSFFRGRFTILSVNPQATTPAKFQYGPSNESAKLNLHAVAQWEADEPGSGVNALLQLPHMTEPIANALLDWIDTDSEARSQGAESEYYGALSPAYSARNGVPLALDELLLVRDVNRSILYGKDLNYDFYTDPNELSLQTDEESSESLEDDNTFPWTWLLTVHSAERNENATGEPLINVNQADLQQLHAAVTESLGAAWANYIVAYRQYGQAAEKRDPAAFSSAQPVDSLTMDYSKPVQFPINNLLALVGTTIKKPAIGEEDEVIYASPLSGSGSGPDDELTKLFTNLTVDSEPVLIGKVNLNLAPAPVLKAVPGMDDPTLEAIQSARENQSSTDPASRQHAIWPLLEEAVTLEKMEELIPYLTCGGNVYQAQVVGFYDQTGPSMRAEVIIDGTQGSPRVVKWTDLRMQGQPFPPELLGAQLDESEFESAGSSSTSSSALD
ncbi:General secretion pathway protein K [Polystyrenella longa]|uniref:General secretion pathway protein K n=1 Tax=Polystyrenella longa TaxID=2528007 RepID=A0A518CRF0_9PLAN|nr:type II secretion system protein GspK [Polystyrenella longa]QDU81790.1 General secretion pathway protein K [Polystyrenella longa]